ncbi:hypothetical protein [Fictibacillus fluitans]|uniref:ABC transporter permease n=1 Tax=Fictibacillus fluitans TaxID=3058422 RepID=A0ABT8HTE8_9BACL|nr:hypothetical protein [Fictibacillus sp. NE201]MDN4524046.1 hypothetical protein [Fictibacillus sp. NE201]
MIRFMKLELRKHKIGGLMTGLLVINLLIAGGLTGLAYGVKLTQGVHIFSSYSLMVLASLALIRPVALIFSALFLSRIVIEEFKNKTIALMFLYPYSRKQVLVYKALMVFLFTVLVVLGSTLFFLMAILSLNPFFHVIEGSMRWSDLLGPSLYLVMDAVLLGLSSLIPMYVGLLKFSAPALFASEIILLLMLSSSISANPISYSAVGLAGVLAVVLSVRRVNNLDF